MEREVKPTTSMNKYMTAISVHHVWGGYTETGNSYTIYRSGYLRKRGY